MFGSLAGVFAAAGGRGGAAGWGMGRGSVRGMDTMQRPQTARGGARQRNGRGVGGWGEREVEPTQGPPWLDEMVSGMANFLL